MEKIRPSFLLFVFFILIGLSLITSCSGPKIQKSQSMGVYHRVKKNETAQMIAGAYQIRLQKLAQMNNAIDLNSIKEGDVLFIPEANRVIDNTNTNIKATDTASNTEVKKTIPKIIKKTTRNQDTKKDVRPAKEVSVAVHKRDSSPDTKSLVKQQAKTAVLAKPAPLKTFSGDNTSEERMETKSKFKKSKEEIKTDKNRFIWPVRGTVKTRFGLQPNKTYNNWIKIVSGSGTKVKAAASGTVIFSSDLKNYGETIIIRHKDNFATVYTHLKKRYVRIDQNVRKGEAIALMAEKDDAGEAYINFEIRFKGKAHNPLSFLP
ncbi:lipoprotein nlpd [hydrocarbon metagenome]|uniref:Lipoprotein nlpd n=1 Tax=hydrocarbon metagenome TaxID=938273 RepID=A0A0W8FLU1_9ZZZZ